LRAKHPAFQPDIAYIHSDDASEWQSGEFQSFLQEQGITLETTAPYTPAQNGLAERANRTVIEVLRSLLIQLKLPHTLWPTLLNLAILHINISPKPDHAQAGHQPTPYQELYGRPSPLYARLNPCGALI
jgi:transposase InsO family protein